MLGVLSAVCAAAASPTRGAAGATLAEQPTPGDGASEAAGIPWTDRGTVAIAAGAARSGCRNDDRRQPYAQGCGEGSCATARQGESRGRAKGQSAGQGTAERGSRTRGASEP